LDSIIDIATIIIIIIITRIIGACTAEPEWSIRVMHARLIIREQLIAHPI
jgi:hypothetical protein